MVRYSAITDPGRYRNNDDRIMINGRIASAGSLDGIAETPVLATVCDGVGGYSFGGEAAEIASRIFSGMARTLLTQSSIETAISNANSEVLLAQQADNDHKNMSATVAGIYINGSDFIVFNAGDSRVYRLKSTYLCQLSVDHTYVQESLNLGLVKSKSEIREKDRHIITRCIDGSKRCKATINSGKNRISVGDVFLICSDGLSDSIDDQALEAILNMRIDLSEKCDKLLQTSLRNGSQDNISIVLLEVA